MISFALTGGVCYHDFDLRRLLCANRFWIFFLSCESLTSRQASASMACILSWVGARRRGRRWAGVLGRSTGLLLARLFSRGGVQDITWCIRSSKKQMEQREKAAHMSLYPSQLVRTEAVAGGLVAHRHELRS